MKNHSRLVVYGFHAIGIGILLFAGAVSAQQPDGSRPPITFRERRAAPSPEPLGTDVATLRRQARALQRELADRDKAYEKLERALAQAREESDQRADTLRQLNAELDAAQDREEAAVTASRRHEKALEQAMQEAEKMRQEMDALEEETKMHQAFAEQVARENETLREMVRGQGTAQTTASSVSGSSLLADAHRLLDEGQVEDAAGLFRQGIARWPDDPAYPVGLASCHYASGKLEVAKALLEKILDDDGDQAEAQGLLGLILWRENDLRQAERYLARAVRGQPDNERWQVYLGMVQYARGRQDQARKAFEQAIQINPLNPEAQFNLAVLLAGDRNPDLVKARVHYEQARGLGTPPDPELEKLIYGP